VPGFGGNLRFRKWVEKLVRIELEFRRTPDYWATTLELVHGQINPVAEKALQGTVEPVLAHHLF
jgi:hypothetical protein